ncbi:6-carboxytetrahydropterin synthase [Kitasatospora sp. MBT63]|uniref:6-pyruvoyl trahydropterin synthase family protein n=1 Tax=Kitasatospora sp. MBT63 TaxID=1444768 RepID=UPI000539A964|nr:6-carboxytetrahydropterin synthase [Kitasatospora sp. MBT63]
MTTVRGRHRIGKRFRFEASHFLTGLAPGHQCARMHGHSYEVEFILTAQELDGPGFVTDFGDLGPVKAYIDTTLDHRVLNEVLPIVPTSENLAEYLAGWFIDNVESAIPGQLSAVRVSETPTSMAEFEVAR